MHWGTLQTHCNSDDNYHEFAPLVRYSQFILLSKSLEAEEDNRWEICNINWRIMLLSIVACAVREKLKIVGLILTSKINPKFHEYTPISYLHVQYGSSFIFWHLSHFPRTAKTKNSHTATRWIFSGGRILFLWPFRLFGIFLEVMK